MVAAASISASTIYDNSDPARYLSNFFAPASSSTEFGDEVTFAGTDRVVTDFKVEYFNDNIASLAGKSVTLRLYSSAGNQTAPGALLYSATEPLGATGFNTITVSGLSLAVPDNVTWTVQFGGLAGGDSAGLPLYDPPTIGSSFDDFWQNSGSGFSLFRFPGGDPNANFAAQFNAVPEVSPVQYALFGGLILLAVSAYRRSVRVNRS